MLDERGMNSLKKNGYVAYDEDPTFETVAKTMEYAIADAAIAKVAKLLGKTEDYKYFLKRSQSYRRLFDPETQFMRGVGADGKFRDRKSTRLNSSHANISYAVFCLKKK